jgi:hypothetical protein
LASFGQNEATPTTALPQAQPVLQTWNIGEMTVKQGNPKLPASFSPDFGYQQIPAINCFAYRN